MGTIHGHAKVRLERRTLPTCPHATRDLAIYTFARLIRSRRVLAGAGDDQAAAGPRRGGGRRRAGRDGHRWRVRAHAHVCVRCAVRGSLRAVTGPWAALAAPLPCCSVVSVSKHHKHLLCMPKARGTHTRHSNYGPTPSDRHAARSHTRGPRASYTGPMRPRSPPPGGAAASRDVRRCPAAPPPLGTAVWLATRPRRGLNGAVPLSSTVRATRPPCPSRPRRAVPLPRVLGGR